MACTQTKLMLMMLLQVFEEPVTDDIAADYSSIIHEPICFADIQDEAKHFNFKASCDVRDAFVLLFANCMSYNAPSDAVSKLAVSLAEAVQYIWERVVTDIPSQS